VQGAYSICWQSDDGASHSVQTEGKDLSASGISVLCAEELQPGTIVFIQGPDGSPNGYSMVRYCTPAGGFHRVGLEFSEETRKSVHIAAPEVTDYYEFLQMNPKAEPAAIHRIYRFMAARFHPDNPGSGDPEKFLLLNRIYEVLSDPKRRAEYDATRQEREPAPDPIFELNAFVDGIEGEVNRRLAILALLYNKRRTNSQDPSISLWDLERKMAMPREYLDFATWYLKSKHYIMVADNSDFALTALGVDYVEANAEKDSMLRKLLTAGGATAAGFGMDRGVNGQRSTPDPYQLGPARVSSLGGRPEDPD
jgi:curved DNA-binding protein CbpA